MTASPHRLHPTSALTASAPPTQALIPPADRARVFERFWRGPAAAAISGRGVGHAVVDEIVHAHAGHVEVTDNDGSGAPCIVALPAD